MVFGLRRVRVLGLKLKGYMGRSDPGFGTRGSEFRSCVLTCGGLYNKE